MLDLWLRAAGRGAAVSELLSGFWYYTAGALSRERQREGDKAANGSRIRLSTETRDHMP